MTTISTLLCCAQNISRFLAETAEDKFQACESSNSRNQQLHDTSCGVPCHRSQSKSTDSESQHTRGRQRRVSRRRKRSELSHHRRKRCESSDSESRQTRGPWCRAPRHRSRNKSTDSGSQHRRGHQRGVPRHRKRSESSHHHRKRCELSDSESQQSRGPGCGVPRHRKRSKSSDSVSQQNDRHSIVVGTVSFFNGKRVRNKKLPCFLCKSEVLWLSRHLERNHSDNILVAEVMAKTGNARKIGLKRLKNLGTFQHNINVLKSGHGELIVVRRTTGKRSPYSYLPCSKCYGFFSQIRLVSPRLSL